jgi:CPA1 family monovalent cation:H+ antiporter
METTGIVLIMLLAVVVSRFMARLTHLPVPLIQIALGATIFYSGLTWVEMDPEVFFCAAVAAPVVSGRLAHSQRRPVP